MGTDKQMKRLYRTNEAATYLGRSAWQVRKLVQDGQLSVVQHSEGGQFLFDVRDLDGFIDRNKRVAPDFAS